MLAFSGMYEGWNQQLSKNRTKKNKLLVHRKLVGCHWFVLNISIYCSSYIVVSINIIYQYQNQNQYQSIIYFHYVYIILYI